MHCSGAKLFHHQIGRAGSHLVYIDPHALQEGSRNWPWRSIISLRSASTAETLRQSIAQQAEHHRPL